MLNQPSLSLKRPHFFNSWQTNNLCDNSDPKDHKLYYNDFVVQAVKMYLLAVEDYHYTLRRMWL